jgi:hypothetical protein
VHPTSKVLSMDSHGVIGCANLARRSDDPPAVQTSKPARDAGTRRDMKPTRFAKARGEGG